MSYNIGQLRGSSLLSSSTPFLGTEVEYSINTQKQAALLGDTTIYFLNRTITPSISLSASNVYYLKFSVIYSTTYYDVDTVITTLQKAISDNELTTEEIEECITALSNLNAGEAFSQDFTVQLENANSTSEDSTIQEIKTFSVAKSASADNVNSVSFEIIFQPISTYDTIVFDLVRTSIDFYLSNEEDSSTSGRVQEIAVDAFYILDNLIEDFTGDNKIQKIGLQGYPGMMFTIDGEEMRIGKSGVYEMHHDSVTMSYIGVVASYGDNFILDYKYGNTDDVSITEADTSSEDEGEGNGNNES